MKTKITFNRANFAKNNTPDKLAKVVNTLLIAGGAIAAIGLAIAAPPVGIAVGTQIAAYAGTSVAILKIVSKLFGEEQK